MDPVIALLSWLTCRGGTNGPLFCYYTITRAEIRLNNENPLSVKQFTSFLRDRLVKVGIGQGGAKIFTGHSIKRGSVQLYRSLSLRDEMIMEIIQMTVHHAYENYCAAYNDFAPEELPRFSNIADYIAHANIIGGE